MTFISKISISLIKKFLNKKFGNRDLETFEKFLNDHSNWKCITKRDKKTYIYKPNSLFKIEIPDEQIRIEEKWVKKFPDKESNYIVNVYLKIGDQVVYDPVPFMFLDGFRIFLPWPKTGYTDDTNFYRYWSKESLEHKIAKIIGEPSKEELITASC